MAEIQEVTIDQLPETDSAKGGVIPIRKNAADYKLKVEQIFLVENNLSEGDPEKIRDNLSVYSKDKVDQSLSDLGELLSKEIQDGDNALDKKVDDLDTALSKKITDAISELSTSIHQAMTDMQTDLNAKIALINRFGNALIGEVVEWPSAKMPQEIWPNLGMVFIPYMGQTFSGTTYPDLALIHPELKLPFDPRGKFRRGWDNGAGVDTNRTINTVQQPTLLRTGISGYEGEDIGTVTAIGVSFKAPDSVLEGNTVTDWKAPNNTTPVGMPGSSKNLADDTGVGGTINTNSIPTPYSKFISIRPINYATNLIVRAK